MRGMQRDMDAQATRIRSAVARGDVRFLRELEPHIYANVIDLRTLAEALAEKGDPALYRELAPNHVSTVRHALAGEVLRLNVPEWQACLEAVKPDVTHHGALRGQIVGQSRVRSLMSLASLVGHRPGVKWLLARDAPVNDEVIQNAANSSILVDLIIAYPRSKLGLVRAEKWDLFRSGYGLGWDALRLPSHARKYLVWGDSIRPTLRAMEKGLETGLASSNLARYVLRRVK